MSADVTKTKNVLLYKNELKENDKLMLIHFNNVSMM